MKTAREQSKLAPLLILLLWLNPVIYFIKFNQITPWGIDTILLWSVVGVIALLSAGLSYWGNWICRIIIISITISLTLSFIPSISAFLWLRIIGIIVLIGLLWLTDNTITVLTFMATALVLSTLFVSVGHQFVGTTDQRNDAAPKPGQGPLMLQIVLDEHIGPNGIPMNFPQGPAMRQFIEHFYLNHGFTLYTNAYSRYPRTYDSIPNMLNFTAESQHTAYFPDGIHHLTLDHAKAFNIAEQHGYQIRVFQAYYINFCRAQGISFGRCFTYATRDIRQADRFPLSIWARNNYTFKSFLLNSSWYQAWIEWYANNLKPDAAKIGIQLPYWPWGLNQLSSPSAMQVFPALTQDIEQHPQGVYIFAHILLPHSPYVYTNNCQFVKSPDNWYINYDEGPVANSPDRRKLRYHYYLQQMRCVYKPLGDMLTQLDKQGLLSNAYIVIQGDHGSRINEHGAVMGNEPYVNWQDFTDSYDALYAIRTPTSTPGIIPTRLPITYLYGQWISEALGQAIPHDNTAPYVYLTVRDTSLRVNMTKFALNQFKDAPASTASPPVVAADNAATKTATSPTATVTTQATTAQPAVTATPQKST